MVKVIGPVVSFGGFQPLRKQRKTYPPSIPPYSVFVSGGYPLPNPDCLGWYDYMGVFEGQPYWKRVEGPTFYIYYHDVTHYFYIATTLMATPVVPFWAHATTPSGVYSKYGTYLGVPIVSDPT